MWSLTPAAAPDTRSPSGRYPALAGVVAALATLGTLAALLPGPLALVLGTDTVGANTVGAGVAAATEQALLSAAGLIVWALLGWHVLLVAVALLGRVPGGAGRRGRVLLRLLAPWTAARIVAAAVGLTVLSGTSACAAGPSPGSSPAAEPSAVSESTPTTGSGDPEVGDAEPARATASMSIDWPDTGSAVTPSPTAPPKDRPTTSTSRGAVADAAPRTGPTAGPPASGTARHGPARVADAVTDSPVTPVTVRAGDSLWSIAQHHLPADATDQDTDIAWRAWYVANSATIGGNPDVIQPGQLLLPPASRTG